MDFITHMLKKHRATVLGILSVLALIAIYLSSTVRATGPFTAGTELDPDCTPGAVDCVVTVGGAGWGLDGNSGTDDTINFIGTTDDEALIFKVDNISFGKLYSSLTFFGSSAGSSNTTGFNNTAMGSNAFSLSTTGFSNTAIGANALAANSDGDENTAIGVSAIQDSIDGNKNVAIGRAALGSHISGDNNTAVGSFALRSSSSTSNNTALGFEAGFNGVGSNIFIGYQAGKTFGTNSNELWIDNSDTATPLLFGDFSGDSLTINGDLEITGTCDGCRPYDVYVAIISQSGTGAPTEDIVLENTLGGVTWARIGAGVYTITLDTPASAENKIFTLTQNSIQPGVTYTVQINSVDEIQLLTGDAGNGSETDDLLLLTPIEIRVYP